MRNNMSVTSKTPIYDYPANATVARTTWFEQWALSMKPEFDSKMNVAMKRTNMRHNIIELIHEAKEVNVLDPTNNYKIVGHLLCSGLPKR